MAGLIAPFHLQFNRDFEHVPLQRTRELQLHSTIEEVLGRILGRLSLPKGQKSITIRLAPKSSDFERSVERQVVEINLDIPTVEYVALIGGLQILLSRLAYGDYLLRSEEPFAEFCKIIRDDKVISIINGPDYEAIFFNFKRPIPPEVKLEDLRSIIVGTENGESIYALRPVGVTVGQPREQLQALKLQVSPVELFAKATASILFEMLGFRPPEPFTYIYGELPREKREEGDQGFIRVSLNLQPETYSKLKAEANRILIDELGWLA